MLFVATGTKLDLEEMEVTLRCILFIETKDVLRFVARCCQPHATKANAHLVVFQEYLISDLQISDKTIYPDNWDFRAEDAKIILGLDKNFVF